MQTLQHGDVPRGLWLLILLGFLTLLPFSLLLILVSPPAGLALLALTVLVGWLEWRAWKRSREVTSPARPRRARDVGRARRNLRTLGIALLGLIVAFLFGSFVSGCLSGFFEEFGTSSAPGDPSAAGVIDSDAFWSPDSRLIAFDRSDYGSPDEPAQGPSDVLVASADGSELRPLTRTPESETVLGWLSHPLRVVYSVRTPKGPTTVYALDLEGGAPLRLGELRPADALLALSHDARRALVATPWRDPKHYALVDFAQKTRRLLPGAAWADGAWSGDDSMLAYSTGESIVILRGGRVLRRVPLGRYDDASGGLAWSPDGRRLAYGSSWGDSSSLWLVRIEDGSRSRLSGGGDSTDQYPFWSPDGSTIYYEDGSYDGDDGLRAIAPDGTDDRKITDDDFDGFLGTNDHWLDRATISPDGTKIVYLLNEAGDWKHWSLVGVMNADGSGKTPFPGSP